MNADKNNTCFVEITVEEATSINGGGFVLGNFGILGNISGFIRWSPLRIIRTKR